MAEDLVGTLEHPGEFDALVKLRPGEPYFPLIGRDVFAPPLVDEWADRNRRRALAEYDEGKISGERRDHELRQSTQAEMIACAMRAFKKGQPADSGRVERSVPSYSGHELDDATLERDRQQAALSKAARDLHNAVAQMADAAEVARKYGLAGSAAVLDGAINAARKSAEAITPARPLPKVAG